MRPITLILAIAVGLITTSDMLHGLALRHWRDGDALVGMNLLVNATRVNPFNFSARLDQIESLYMGYRQTKNMEYLREAVVIARSLTTDYPGSVQGWAVYSTALLYATAHGGSSYYPLGELTRAANMDPLSTVAIENTMFLLASSRGDYELFKTLGMRRARLTTDRLTMKCELCGRPWLEHGGKSK